ncbi:MAG TPA: hypothetical protein VIE69_02265 [Methylophilaceae bacterium]
MELIIIGGLIFAGWVMLSNYLDKRRRENLFSKYHDEHIVDMIMKKMVWQDQTHGQLIDSLGPPVDVDKQVMKTKTKEVWKYHQTGKNRFGLRVTFEDNVVVGWDKKA